MRHLFLLCLLCVFGLSGCSVTRSLLLGRKLTSSRAKRSKKRSSRVKVDVDELERNKDLEGLSSYCQSYSGPIQERSRACKVWGRLQADSFGSMSCARPDVIEGKYRSVRSHRAARRSEVKQMLFSSMSIKMARCGLWKRYFVRYLHWGGGLGAGSLKDLTAAGLPVEQKLFGWLKEQRVPFQFKHGEHALGVLITWLNRRRQRQHCGSFLKYSKRSSEKMRRVYVRYFYEADCKRAAPVVASLLSSSSARARRVACRALGKLGGRRELRKVSILAQTDGYFVIRKRRVGDHIVFHKDYVVRRVCHSASGKIRLRL